MNILYYDKNNCNPEELRMIYEHIEALHESGKIEDTIILPKFCDFKSDVSIKELQQIIEEMQDIYNKGVSTLIGTDSSDDHTENTVMPDGLTGEELGSPVLENSNNCPNCGSPNYY